MTGRYFRREISWEAYAQAFDLTPPPHVDAPLADYNIAPMSLQPIIRQRETYQGGGTEMAPCTWGLIPSWWTKPLSEKKFTGFTADAAHVHERAVYRGAFRHRRALIPASGYYVWTGEDGAKIPFAVALREQDWFCFAGLWDAALIDGSHIETFTILTTDPNDAVAGIATRMPVILRPEDCARWLDPSLSCAGLFEPYPAAEMTAWPVNAAVGNVRNNGPDLIAEA